MKYKIYYFNDSLLPGRSANKVARTNMSKAFAKIADVELVNFYFFVNNRKSAKQFVSNKVNPKPVYLPFFHDINEEKSKLYTLIHLFYYPWIILGFIGFFLIKKFSPEDIIFIRSEKITLALWIASFFRKISFSFEFNNYEFEKNRIKVFVFRKYANKSSVAVTVSNHTKQNWVVNGVDEKKIIVLPSGFDADLYTKIKISKIELRKELDLPLDKRIATYTGSIQKYRGIEEIIIAAKHLKEVEFLIFGDGDVVYYQEYVEKKFGLLENLHFKGFVANQDIPKYLKSSDVLLAPYAKKCQIIEHISPIKLFEYMASDIPIIISDFPRIREIVSGREVIFVESDNGNDLAKKIELILENKIDILSITKNASHLAEKFTWDKRSEEIFNQIKIKQV